MDKDLILKFQKNELTEHIIYKTLTGLVRKEEHRQILRQISEEEIRHYAVFKALSGQESIADRFKIFWFVLISRVLGLNFGLKLMESGEDLAQDAYGRLKNISPEIESIIQEEEQHEKELISLIDEERLKYISSMVLGLNDALVELTGSLAGFTLALQNARLIGVVGLITGLAASMFMASSEYLSIKHQVSLKNPLKASIYTGISYLGTVLFLIFPYFLSSNIYICLAFTVMNALLVILIFTFYTSVAIGLPFKRRFFEMSSLSLGIAAISFCIGLGVRRIFGIEV